MHYQQKSGSSSAPPTPGYTSYPSFSLRQGLRMGPSQLASALFVAYLDHGGLDCMVWRVCIIVDDNQIVYHVLLSCKCGRVNGFLMIIMISCPTSDWSAPMHLKLRVTGFKTPIVIDPVPMGILCYAQVFPLPFPCSFLLWTTLFKFLNITTRQVPFMCSKNVN